MTVSNCELPPHDATDNARYDPDDIEVQPRAKRALNYAETAKIDQSSPRYSRYSIADDSKILKQAQMSQTLVGDYQGVWSTETWDSKRSFLENAILWRTAASKPALAAIAVLPITHENPTTWSVGHVLIWDTPITLNFTFSFLIDRQIVRNLTSQHCWTALGVWKRM